MSDPNSDLIGYEWTVPSFDTIHSWVVLRTHEALTNYVVCRCTPGPLAEPYEGLRPAAVVRRHKELTK